MSKILHLLRLIEEKEVILSNQNYKVKYKQKQMEEIDWHQKETYKSLIAIGSNAIKFVFLVNAGAIIALLTFLGNFLKSKGPYINMTVSMSFFITGVILAGVLHAFIYCTQLRLYNEKFSKKTPTHHIYLWYLIGVYILSLLCFSIGSYYAVKEIKEAYYHNITTSKVPMFFVSSTF